ncbi:hypothetical protein A3Q29_21225 [Providencia stuartii]|uniref:Uncharacterized protein n=1 Tax=Providencia stuartii TaxID=588 RepID=A0A1S1HRW9_PROST|nr:hypothetical protein A3Q29_21225 [Providencia stuartii]
MSSIVIAFFIGFLIYGLYDLFVVAKEKTIAEGARYSTLAIFKTKEQNGKVFYYLGDEKHEIEVSQYDYDRAIKAYQKTKEIQTHD